MAATGLPDDNCEGRAATDLRLPLFSDGQVAGWPGEHAPGMAYVDTATLFLATHAGDAHTAAYSVPEVPHRLTLDGLGLLAGGEGWRMVLLHLEVDPPRKGERPPDEAGQAALRELRAAWWQAEQAKLTELAQLHPGAFVYQGRSGGYHIVWILPTEVVLRTHDDKNAWRERYHRELLHLARTVGIVADPRGADITRLFRLPRRTRAPGDAPLDPVTFGDPSSLGTWTHLPGPDELAADLATAQALAETDPVAWGSVARRLAPRPPSDDPPVGRTTFRGDDQDETRSFKRAAAYLSSMNPSVEGEGGDTALWLAALAMVRGFALGPDTATDLLWQAFNPRCRPPWARSVIERTCREAATRGEMPWGHLRAAERPSSSPAGPGLRSSPDAPNASSPGDPSAAANGENAGPAAKRVDGLGPYWAWASDLGWPDTKPPRRACILRRPAEGDEDTSYAHDFLPLGKVALLTGAGGAGKTMSLVQLAVSVITGHPWLGHYEVPVEARGPVLLALAEEDAEDAQRRLWAVREHLGMTSEAWQDMLRQLLILPLAGVDVALVSTDRHTRETTRTAVLAGLRQRLDEASVDWRLLVLDPLSRWAGAETDRHAATHLVAALATLTRVRGRPTVMLAHRTSQAACMGHGFADASAASDLTDSVRWVATLGPHPKSGPFPALSLVKSNDGPPAEMRTLRRGDGGILSAMSPGEQTEHPLSRGATAR